MDEFEAFGADGDDAFASAGADPFAAAGGMQMQSQSTDFATEMSMGPRTMSQQDDYTPEELEIIQRVEQE